MKPIKIIQKKNKKQIKEILGKLYKFTDNGKKYKISKSNNKNNIAIMKK